MSPLNRLLCLVAFAISFSSTSVGQIVAVSNDQATPVPGVGHDYIKMLSETVEPASGQLSVRIEIPSLQNRMSFPFAYIYNSAGVHHVIPLIQGKSQWVSDIGDTNGTGWSSSLPQITATKAVASQSFPGPPPYTASCVYFTNYVFQDSNGARHAISLQSWQSKDSGSPNYCYQVGGGSTLLSVSNDGQLQASTINPPPDTVPSIPPPVTVVSSDGTVYNCESFTELYQGWTTYFRSYCNAIEDRNGNYPAPTTYLNATATQESVPSQAFSFNSVRLDNDSQAQCWNIANSTGSLSVYQSIILPNGKGTQFQYDATYGTISKITYPNGGYVTYTWGQSHDINGNDDIAETVLVNDINGLVCQWGYDTPVITHRYVSFDGASTALQQDFYYKTTWPSGGGGWTSKQTIVITHDILRGTSYQTTYNYQPDSTLAGAQGTLESSIVYQDFNGNTLLTVNKGWQGYLMCQLKTLNNGQVSGAFYGYGSGAVLTDVKEYDFGQISSGSSCYGSATVYPVATPPSGVTPVRETVMTPQSFGVTPIFQVASIFDRPTSIKTYGNGTLLAETDYTYDQSLPLCASSPQCVTPANHDESKYGPNSTAPRGNATMITKRCLQGCSTNPVSTYIFDETGQVLSKTDPCGNAACADLTGTKHITSYSWNDKYTPCGGAAPVSANANAYLTQITNALGQIESFCYGYNDGQLRSSTDANNLTTTYKYGTTPTGCTADVLDRLGEIDYPDNGKTTYCYNDGNYNASTSTPSVTTTRAINSSQSLTTVSARDGMGHVIQTKLTSDPQGTVYTDTAYDGLGRVWKQSNPYRSGSDVTSSPGTTTYAYDALGRKTSETYPDPNNSVLTTAYCGPSTLVTDPTKRWRRSRVDGLGHLVEVDEPNAVGASVASNGCPGTGEPIWITSYTVDPIGNLTKVVQNGTHQRTFTYDSLSRLLCANNPETSSTSTPCPPFGSTTFPVGTLQYSYDANGNLSAKKDARSITTTYGYDAVNRELSRTYSDGTTSSVTIVYDQANCLNLTSCQNIGYRTSMTDGAGSEAWAYQVDKTNLRNVHTDQRTIVSGSNNITKTTTYYLDLLNNPFQIAYPANPAGTGQVVKYTYDSANRPSTASDGSNGITYATGFQTPPSGCPSNAVCYTPEGTFYALSIGQSSDFTGLNLTHKYNIRLQPVEFQASSSGGNAMDISYSFQDPLNNNTNAGHVFQITNNLNSSRTQKFNYDQVNRIISAGASATTGSYCWGYQYTYDAWANLTAQAGWTPTYNACTEVTMPSVVVDNNNHMPSPVSYDSSGNTTSDGLYSYSWDAESQLKSGAGINYSYDGDGLRVAKVGSKLYWYGTGGEILAETDSSGNVVNQYVYFAGRRIALISSSTH